MRTLAILLLFCFGTSHIIGQSKYVRLFGTIERPINKKVYVKYYTNFINYEEEILDSALLDRSGKFSMKFKLDKPTAAIFCHGDEISELYLNPGDSLKITLNARKFDESIMYEGKGSFINNYKAQKIKKFSYINPIIFKAEETEVLYVLDSIRSAKRNFLSRYFSTLGDDNLGIMRFIENEKFNIDYEFAYNAMIYPGLHAYISKIKEKFNVSPGYYDFLTSISVINSVAINSSSYLDFLPMYVNHEVAKLSALDTLQTLDQIKIDFLDSTFSDELLDFLYAQWIYELLNHQSDFEKARNIYYNHYLKTERAYKDILDSEFNTFNELKTGNMAPEFTLEMDNGKYISLSDFRGKVVYIDIWATWCGPCIREIPHMDTLINAMTGQDVVFLSISIDNDPKKWRKMIRNRDMKGIHLISPGNFESIIANMYHVTGVPHYVIIDRSGHLVDNNAPRPSMGVKKTLDDLIDSTE